MKKKTTERFIEDAKKIHGDKYDYSLVRYDGSRIKVKIVCPIHGIFEQSPSDHLNGNGCQKCGKFSTINKLKSSTKEFIKKAKKVYGFEYLYNKTEYINSKTKVLIFCKKHGDFYTNPTDFLRGHGCYKCGLLKTAEKRTKPFSLFLKEARKVHGYDYLYFKKTYKNNHSKIKIYCKRCHNIFWQTPLNHLSQKQGCPYCFRNFKKTTEQFIAEAKLIHGDRYDYSEVNYINSSVKVKIKCNYCNNIFWQEANSHLQGHNCPYCTKSEGEIKIEQFFSKRNINFVINKEFNSLIDKDNLSYDFYLKDYNLLIEYNGQQHYENSFHKPIHEWHRQLHHDWLKRKYAKDHNIKLLTISYKEYKIINEVLEKVLDGE